MRKLSATGPVELDTNEAEPVYKKFKGVGGQVEPAVAQQQRQSGPGGSSNTNANPIDSSSAGLSESKKRTLSEMQINSDPRARPASQVPQVGMLVSAAAVPPQINAVGAQTRNSMLQIPVAPAMRTVYDTYGLPVFC